MNGEKIKALESRLWKAADELRANSKLTATEYSFPVLGIIFLRHPEPHYYTYLYKHQPSKENRYYTSRVVPINNYY